MSTRVCTHCGKDCYNAARRIRDQRRYHELHPKAVVRVDRPNIPNRPTPASGDPNKFQPDIKDMLTAYLNLAHWKPENIGNISRERYNKHFNLEVEEVAFKDLEQKAAERLEEQGYYNATQATFPREGTYLVIGDTFGTHTPEGVFQLLQQVIREEKVSNIICMGHNLDDENLISNLIGKLGAPVTLIAMRDELQYLHAQRDYGYNIVQHSVVIGDILLRNQEHITPYVKTYIGNLDPMMFNGRMIVNCTRQELAIRPTPHYEDTKNFIASPGCLSDPHVVTTINRLIFANGMRAMLRPTNTASYHKHRKNETDKLIWERGFILLKNGKVYQRRIFNDGSEYRTIVNGGIMNNSGEHIPCELTLVLSDLHAPYALQGTLVSIIQAHPLVNRIIFNGDVLDMRSFNPHNPEEATRVDLQDELEELSTTLERMVGDSEWRPWHSGGLPPQIEFLMGNHEDFMLRFVNKYPQFAKCFKKLIWDVLTKYGTITGDEQDWATIGNTIVTHGSADIFGLNGNNMEKAARTFQRQTIIGHTHSPAIRFGSYRTGCLCKLAQGYNNSKTSNWEVGYARVYSDEKNEYVELVNL